MADTLPHTTFYGGRAMLLVPIVFFMAMTAYLFIGQGAFDLMALALVGFLTLILGALLSRSQKDYWKAAFAGIASEMSATVVLLLLAAGIFSAMMKAGGLSSAMTALGAFRSHVYRLCATCLDVDGDCHRLIDWDDFDGDARLLSSRGRVGG